MQSAELLNKAMICAQLSLSPRCLELMVKRGEFPPPVRVGKHVYWSTKAIEAWRVRLFGAQESWRPVMARGV